MREDVRREESELLPREIATGPGELGAGHVAPEVEAGLEILDRREHEEKGALVVGTAPRANAREDVVGELQFRHAVDSSGARAARRTRPVDRAGADSGKADVSSSTSALTRPRLASSGCVRARSISSATRTISARPIPRVVSAGVPRR